MPQQILVDRWLVELRLVSDLGRGAQCSTEDISDGIAADPFVSVQVHSLIPFFVDCDRYEFHVRPSSLRIEVGCVRLRSSYRET